MQKILKSYIKKLFSDLHAVAISITVVALLAGSGIVYRFYKNLWLSLINTMRSPAPLWATIALILLVILYTHRKAQKVLSSNPPKDRKEFIEACKFLWEATFKNNEVLHVSKVPFCKIHRLRLTEREDTYRCMEKDCKTSIECHLLPGVYKIALTFIERDIKNMS